VDYGGARNVAEAMAALKKANPLEPVPKLVLISSLGVTRPYWPITIMLNTFGGRVMTYKLRGEDAVRERCTAEGLDYTIIRPGRLVPLEKHPQLAGGDLVTDQGDKVTGQILRSDLAAVGIHCALNRDAALKSTFELVSADSITEPEHRETVAKAEGRGRSWATLVASLKSDFQVATAAPLRG
jgi:nucleoside-diphosphate-sugar epimerase